MFGQKALVLKEKRDGFRVRQIGVLLQREAADEEFDDGNLVKYCCPPRPCLYKPCRCLLDVSDVRAAREGRLKHRRQISVAMHNGSLGLARVKVSRFFLYFFLMKAVLFMFVMNAMCFILWCLLLFSLIFVKKQFLLCVHFTAGACL